MKDNTKERNEIDEKKDIPFCTSANDPENARNENEDEPCKTN